MLFQSRVRLPSSLTLGFRGIVEKSFQIRAESPGSLTRAVPTSIRQLFQSRAKPPGSLTLREGTLRARCFTAVPNHPVYLSSPQHPPIHGYPRDYSERLAARPCQSSRPSHPREPTPSRSPRHTRTALLLFSRHSGAHESGGGGVRSARSCPSSVDSFRHAHLLVFAPFQPSN